MNPSTLATPFKTVSVLDFGADPFGKIDSAPAFRSAIRSNVNVVVPKGTYRFKSLQAAPCCAFDNSAVLVTGQSNFSITGQNATILIDPAIAFSSAFMFSNARQFSVSGLKIVGSRAGLTTWQENAGFALLNTVNFEFYNNIFEGFGGLGAAFAGDWMQNGSINNNTMSGVGQCMDFAFVHNLRIHNNTATGGDTPENAFGGAGVKCWSFIVDYPNWNNNLIGVSAQSDGIAIQAVSVLLLASAFLLPTSPVGFHPLSGIRSAT